MDEKLDKIIRLLIDNGISLNRVGDWFCCTELELDFSEHDKTFEDKITDLEQLIRELIKEKDEYKRKCNDFGFENQDLKKIIKDYEDKIATLEEKLLTSANTVERNRRRNYVLEIKNQKLNQITKGYKDKIAELEKEVVNYKQAFDDKCADYGVTSELLGKYQQENESLKKRVVELENFSFQAEQETESLVEKLKQRIADLESKETLELPFDPLECANYLINLTYERETNGIERTFHNLPDKVNSDRYTVDDLEQIAEHLLVYCKHNKECEE